MILKEFFEFFSEFCFPLIFMGYHSWKFAIFDNSSPGYIKYLGYPIWFSNQQWDIYISELIGSFTALVDIYSIRQVSLYGKANISNTIILSKLWYVIRAVPLPKDTLKKLNSIIYQFVTSSLFPIMKGNSFFLPKKQGGLGLINIGSQQQALQFRYIRVLLIGNYGPMPTFAYN